MLMLQHAYRVDVDIFIWISCRGSRQHPVWPELDIPIASAHKRPPACLRPSSVDSGSLTPGITALCAMTTSTLPPLAPPLGYSLDGPQLLVHKQHTLVGVQLVLHQHNLAGDCRCWRRWGGLAIAGANSSGAGGHNGALQVPRWAGGWAVVQPRGAVGGAAGHRQARQCNVSMGGSCKAKPELSPQEGGAGEEVYHLGHQRASDSHGRHTLS